MDLFEESLADLLKQKRRPMPVARVVRILEQIASAVAFVHSHGLVHRDLKPANVLLDGKGDAYVADFGLAVDPAAGATLTATGNLIGTPDYMAPEQALGDRARVSERTDVYALGAILYECLTGKAPFAGRALVDKVHAVAHEEPTPPRKLAPAVPQAIELICRKAMAKDPDQRYATAEALAEDLRRFADGRPIEARAPTKLQKTGLLLRRNARSIGLVAISAAAAVLFASPWLGATTASRLEDAELLWARGEHGAAALFYERAADGLDGWFSTVSDETRHRVLAGRARALIEYVSRDPADPELREELGGALDALVGATPSIDEDEFADRQLVTVGLETAAWTLIGRPRSRDAYQVIGKYSRGSLRSVGEQEKLLHHWVAFSKDASPALQAVTIEVAASFLLDRMNLGHNRSEARKGMLRIAELVDVPTALPALLDSLSASVDSRTDTILRFVGFLGWLHLNEAERWQLSEILHQDQSGQTEDAPRLTGKSPKVRRVLLASIARLLDFPVELDQARYDYRQVAVLGLFSASRDQGRAARDEAVLAAMMRAELDPSTHACSEWFERRGYLSGRWIVEEYQAWKDGCQGDYPAAAIRAALGLGRTGPIRETSWTCWSPPLVMTCCVSHSCTRCSRWRSTLPPGFRAGPWPVTIDRWARISCTPGSPCSAASSTTATSRSSSNSPSRTSPSDPCAGCAAGRAPWGTSRRPTRSSPSRSPVPCAPRGSDCCIRDGIGPRSTRTRRRCRSAASCSTAAADPRSTCASGPGTAPTASVSGTSATDRGGTFASVTPTSCSTSWSTWAFGELSRGRRPTG